jgi:hypothetical protein
MEWLLGIRIGVVPIESSSVNDAITKGIVSKTNSVGFELEPDSRQELPISFTWESMKLYKLLTLTKSG